MSDFAEWVQESAGAESKRISTKLYGGMMPEGETMLRDLAQLAAQQHEALEAAVAQACDDEDVERSPCACDWCGAWAEVTNTRAAADAFKEKYG